MRINQFLARAGVTSRRKAEELIVCGAVSVNGSVVTDLTTTVDPEHDKVTVNDGEVLELPKLRYLMLNKPVGYTTTRFDPHAEKTIFELLPEDNTLITVGRLDKETSGLILVTNDGDFAQNVIHPSKRIEKVYVATLKRGIREVDLKKLKDGVMLDDGIANFTYAKRLKENEVEVGIEEGRNRIVRRMFAAVGDTVTRLTRLRIGKITLDIPDGKYRDLTEKEIKDHA